MLFTIGNKFYVNSIYKKSLKEAGIFYTRFQTQPTILNNILWYGIAETDSDYYLGFYSLLDRTNTVENWQKVPKNHDLLDLDHPDIYTMSWFSNGYFNVLQTESNELRYNDLRYPLLNEDDVNSSIFSFIIKKENSRYNIYQYFDNEGPSKDDFNAFLVRVRGI